jgi:hypothetical protein
MGLQLFEISAPLVLARPGVSQRVLRPSGERGGVANSVVTVGTKPIQAELIRERQDIVYREASRDGQIARRTAPSARNTTHVDARYRVSSDIPRSHSTVIAFIRSQLRDGRATRLVVICCSR